MARRKAIEQEALLGNFQKMLDAMNHDDPLPCALIGAAFVENALVRLLRNFLIEASSTADTIFNEGSPLGTFNACAEMAYCLGLVSKPTFQNCLAIAQVRNEFAHRHDAPDFHDPTITKLCSKLRPTNFESTPIPFGKVWSNLLSAFLFRIFA